MKLASLKPAGLLNVDRLEPEGNDAWNDNSRLQLFNRTIGDRHKYSSALAAGTSGISSADEMQSGSSMSKVQGKDTDLLNNLAATGIASELDSHLRNLEKNIAVAREFIKLADESYSELRHKWNLIQEEARNTTGTDTNEKATRSSKKRSPRSQTHELVEREDNAVSKTEEFVGVATEKIPKIEKSKSRNRHGKTRIQPEDSKEASSSTSQSETMKSAKEPGSKRRKDRAHSSTT